MSQKSGTRRTVSFHQLPAEADMERHSASALPPSIRWSLASNATASSHDRPRQKHRYPRPT